MRLQEGNEMLPADSPEQLPLRNVAQDESRQRLLIDITI
jgi:hypothetical protein